MVPHKTKRGAAALERMKTFEGVPPPYDKVKRMVIPDALKVLRLQHGHKYCKLGDLSNSVSVLFPWRCMLMMPAGIIVGTSRDVEWSSHCAIACLNVFGPMATPCRVEYLYFKDSLMQSYYLLLRTSCCPTLTMLLLHRLAGSTKKLSRILRRFVRPAALTTMQPRGSSSPSRLRLLLQLRSGSSRVLQFRFILNGWHVCCNTIFKPYWLISCAKTYAHLMPSTQVPAVSRHGNAACMLYFHDPNLWQCYDVRSFVWTDHMVAAAAADKRFTPGCL